MASETMDESESEPLDRLSELPDSLILTILSFLPMRDVVCTTILSKRWRDVWITTEYLDFWDEYCSFITGAIAKWRGDKVLELSISFPDGDGDLDRDTIDSCLLFPLENGVKDLNIYLGHNPIRKYRLPQLLYTCPFITKLSISHCHKLKIMENVDWFRLKSLTIAEANFLSGEAVSKILEGSPVLEELTLWSFEFDEEFYIKSSSLKKLNIGRHESSDGGFVVDEEVLGIWAPNLLNLDITGFLCSRCLLEVPSLINANFYFQDCGDGLVYGKSPPFEMFEQVFRSIRRVEKVTLSNWCVQSLVCMKKKLMVVPFSIAKFVKLYASEATEILDVLKLFPELKMLTIDQGNQDCCSASVKGTQVAKKRKETFPSPALLRLRTVEISWSLHDFSMIPAIGILLRNASFLEKLVFRPIFFGDNRELLLIIEEKVLSMSRSSTTAEVIIVKDFD